MPRLPVSALFLDLDGTIYQGNRRSSSWTLSHNTGSILHRISTLIPVALITTKDMSFARRLTAFARGWAAINGLEIRVGEDSWINPRAHGRLHLMTSALKYVQSFAKKIDPDLYIERKRLQDGTLAAFCVDWAECKIRGPVRTRIDRLVTYCSRKGLYVARYEDRPYADVLPMKLSKGEALLKLKAKLGVTGPITYMGDSRQIIPLSIWLMLPLESCPAKMLRN